MIGLHEVSDMRTIAFVLLTSAAFSACTFAQSTPHPVLVELFTSEGCSSCPPADALLKKINGYRVSSGQLVVALSEHVTYWNQLGWADPFSAETWTDRQSRYGDRFHLDSVYTPQVVVNGDAQMSGSDAQGILRAVRAESTSSSLQLHIDAASAQPGAVSVTYTVTGAASSPVELYAVIADDMATSSVLRGENSGRTLMHVAVARNLTRIGSIKADGMATISLHEPATIKGQPETARHLVLFAQAPGQGKVVAIESKGF